MLAPWNGIGDLRFQAGGALLAIRDKYISTVSGYSTWGSIFFQKVFSKAPSTRNEDEAFCL